MSERNEMGGGVGTTRPGSRDMASRGTPPVPAATPAGGRTPTCKYDRMVKCCTFYIDVDTITQMKIVTIELQGGGINCIVEVWCNRNPKPGEPPTWTLHGAEAAEFLQNTGSPYFNRANNKLDVQAFQDARRMAEMLVSD